jgi:hypothetical protein
LEPPTLHLQTEDMEKAQGQIMAPLKEEKVELASAAAGSKPGTCALQDLQRGLQAAQEELDGVRAAYEATDANREPQRVGAVAIPRQGLQREKTVEAQLQCAYERLNAAVLERAQKHHAGRHASHALSQTEVEASEALRQRMRTKAGARMEDAWKLEDASLTRRRINQLAEHVEVVFCGGGHGDLHRT